MKHLTNSTIEKTKQVHIFVSYNPIIEYNDLNNIQVNQGLAAGMHQRVVQSI